MVLKYNFEAEVWKYQGKSAWYFVTLPQDYAAEIKKLFFDPMRTGFGSLRVKVKIGKSIWDTSIFPDSQSKSYLLPIKREVRAKENIEDKTKTKVLLIMTEPSPV